MQKTPNRRSLKNYLVLKDVQLKLIAVNFIHMLLIIFITIAALMAPLYNALLASPSLEGQYHAAVAFLLVSDQLPVALALALLLFIAHQFVLTHQFCGPIINFSNTFRAVAVGNLTRKVRLRKYDQLQAEAEGINAMIDGLSQLVSGMRREQADLTASLQEIAIAPDCAESRQKAEAALAAARQRAASLSRLLASFRLPEPEAGRN